MIGKLKYVYILLSLLFFYVNSYGILLRWDVSTGIIYRIKSKVIEDVFVDEEKIKTVELQNKITMEAMDRSNRYTLFFGEYYTQEKNLGKEEGYKLHSYQISKVWMNENGEMIVDPVYLKPVVRNVPVTPAEEVKEGTTWSAQGEEVQQLNLFNYIENLRIPFNALYKVRKIYQKDNKTYAEIEVNYTFVQEVPRSYVISEVAGKVNQIYKWNVSENYPETYSEEFTFIIYLRVGKYRAIKYIGYGNGVVEKFVKPKVEEKIHLAQEIGNILQENKFKGEVKETEKGIDINLSDILFDFGSAEVKEAYKKLVRRIAEVLRDKKNVDIVIEGHTDNVGSESYNYKLSEERAKAVADLFVQYGISPDRISYKGYGPSKPIAPNDTEEGRSKNRRVEIKLMINR